MPHTRAHIRLNTITDVTNFVAKINGVGTVDKYIIEDFAGDQRADARSLLGVIYAMTDYNDQMYLVNETQNGVFPNFVDAYRV